MIPTVTPSTLRIAAGIGAALALLAALAWSHHKAYTFGAADGTLTVREAQLESEQARGKALEKLADANARMLQIQAEADARVAEAQRRGRAQVQTVERVIRENPDFAAAVRPADLDRVRVDDLAEIAAAARRSADLSSESLRGVRSAGAGDGQHAGVD